MSNMLYYLRISDKINNKISEGECILVRRAICRFKRVDMPMK